MGVKKSRILCLFQIWRKYFRKSVPGKNLHSRNEFSVEFLWEKIFFSDYLSSVHFFLNISLDKKSSLNSRFLDVFTRKNYNFDLRRDFISILTQRYDIYNSIVEIRILFKYLFLGSHSWSKNAWTICSFKNHCVLMCCLYRTWDCTPYSLSYSTYCGHGANWAVKIHITDRQVFFSVVMSRGPL
jgi:hypothetical protein